MTEPAAAEPGAMDAGGPDRPRFLPSLSWCLYDWANSAFAAVVTTFVFATFFTRAVAADEVRGTFLWSQAMTVAALIVALASPLLGAIADRGGGNKRWLAPLTLLCVVATAALWFVHPQPDDIAYALVMVVLATIGFELATVFYNALLPAVAPAGWVGRISGFGWGLGYAGGICCLALALFVLVQAEPPPFGLDADAAEPVRATSLLVACWFALFSAPLFLFVREDAAPAALSAGAALRAGAAALRQTLGRLRQRRHRAILWFLLARMLYADGLATLFAFGGIYAAGTFGMSFAEIIQFAIALNVTAGLGAAGFAWIDDRIGPKRTIVISLIGLLGCGVGVLLVQDVTGFWIAALCLGIFVGPVQAASRSYLVHLAPPELRAEMFGLYALSGKATSFLGPAVLGWVTLLADSQRAGMATILGFWLAGLVLLWLVPAVGVNPPRPASRP